MENISKRILVVDDEQSIRTMLRDILTILGYESEMARDGIEALAKLELGIDLILTDVKMGGMDGFELVQRIRSHPRFNEIPIIMVTGMSTRKDRIRAVEMGANDFIAKPFELTEVRVRIASVLRMKAAHDELKHHRQELEQLVKQRTESLRRALDDMVETQRQLQNAYIETINRLVVAAEYKDTGTAGHIQRMSRCSAMLARKINLPPGEVELILRASPMHDIGKIGTPEEILLKPGKLTEQEWNLMKLHPVIGSDILRDSSSKLLQAGEIIALSHHEHWDGSGYPRGIGGEDIPLWGRICAVADVFDALTSKRPYKPAFPSDVAVGILKDAVGTHLDPNLVGVFLQNLSEVAEIQANPGMDQFDDMLYRKAISLN